MGEENNTETEIFRKTNWRDDSAFNDGLRVDTSPEADIDQTQTGSMDDDARAAYERRVRRTNDRIQIETIRQHNHRLLSIEKRNKDIGVWLKPLMWCFSKVGVAVLLGAATAIGGILITYYIFPDAPKEETHNAQDK